MGRQLGQPCRGFCVCSRNAQIRCSAFSGRRAGRRSPGESLFGISGSKLFEPRESVIAEVKVRSNGQIEFPFIIPDDLGGLHGLALRDGEKTVARSHFVIETSIVSMTPASGPVGTPITIHLKGVGWTE